MTTSRLSANARETPSSRPPWWAVVSSTGAVVALVGGWASAEAVQHPGYDPVRNTISALARHGAEHRWVMTAALYAIGACHLITAAGLRGTPRWSRALLAAAGVAGLGLGTFAQPDRGSTDGHLSFAVLGLVTMAVWPLTVVSRTATGFPLRPRDAVFSGLLSAALLVWVVQAMSGTTLGLAERAITFQQELWPLLVVLALRHPRRLPEQEAAEALTGRVADRVCPTSGRRDAVGRVPDLAEPDRRRVT
jgi:hypothetical membrane protein